jgi:hypothetical protein
LGLLLASSPRATAQQVSVSIGYPPPSATSTPASAPGYGPPSARGVAQAVAYAQYLQYLQALNYAALRGGSASDVQQYFTNGAAATTVPSAGPGSSYFTNGAEATVLRPAAAPTAPTAPSAATATPVPAATATTAPSPGGPYPWPFVPAPPQGPPVARATEVPPAPSGTTAVETASSPPVEVAEAQPAPAPVTAMSFEAWLASMGLSPSADEASEGVATTVSEPATLSSGTIARASFAPREKSRKHAESSDGGGSVVGAVGSAFGAGLLLGGLAMFRLRWRRRAGVAPTS